MQSATHIGSEWLDRLRRKTGTLDELPCSNDAGAAPNASGLGCVAETMVHVEFGVGADTESLPMHLNRIDYEPGDPDAMPKNVVYLAGQSPAAAPGALSLACEKTLVQGIHSRQGLYQFVSRRAHYQPEHSKEVPIADQLMQHWKARQPGDPALVLGGRYQVEDFSLLHAADGAPDNRRHYRLGVSDLANPGTTLVIPVTQAGLKFTDKLLAANELMQADQILEAHRALIPDQDKKAPQQADPAMYSYAGIGRNASLTTYRRLARAIDAQQIGSKEKLLEKLHTEILKGRAAKGKKFLHSDAQINVLWTVLSEKLDQKIRADATAIVALQQGRTRTVRAANLSAFEARTFKLRDNGGGGDCLFHALEGTREKPSLTNAQVQEIRNRVADVLPKKARSEELAELAELEKLAPLEQKLQQSGSLDEAEATELAELTELKKPYNANWHAMALSLGINHALLKDFRKNQSIPNSHFANFQRQPGGVAGDTEIQQWLALPENQNKTVTVIDTQIGSESVVTFKHGRARTAETFRQSSSTAEVVEDRIRLALARAILEERSGIAKNDRRQIALFRQPGHFQRIVGLN